MVSDFGEAASWFRIAAEQDDDAETRVRALFVLAQMHHVGKVLPQDQSKALRLAGLAADEGNTKAQQFVERWASEFRSGGNPEHAPRRLIEAERAFWQAVKEGNADKSSSNSAQLQIGHLYRQGHRFVMMQSDEEAAQWYRRAGIRKMAAAQSDEEAARWYGYAATEVHPDAEAQYVPDDAKEAIRFFRLAAEQGHAEALFTLGSYYVSDGHTFAREALELLSVPL
ncbi:hypothetical protein T492DRAFT_909691 [Pavlovales sp. CCMP2436]|nr:hypothetical protein T492DRAFT_909691 [Pavlovales sp. CCMP2436]